MTSQILSPENILGFGHPIQIYPEGLEFIISEKLQQIIGTPLVKTQNYRMLAITF